MKYKDRICDMDAYRICAVEVVDIVTHVYNCLSRIKAAKMMHGNVLRGDVTDLGGKTLAQES